MSSTNPFDANDITSLLSALQNPMEHLTPKPPTFPTVEELLGTVQEVPKQEEGLFETVLQSRTELMYQDSLEEPDKYPQEVRDLLLDLVSKRRTPTAQERLILDRSVLDFSRRLPKTVKPSPQPSSSSARTSSPPSAPDPTPGDIVSPFWWKHA